MKKLILFNLLLCLTLTANAQFDGLVKHWGFDTDSPHKDHFNLFSQTSSEITFSEGTKGQAVVLNNKNYHLNLDKQVDLYDDFSVAFWFSPYQFDVAQTLIYQTKQAEKTGEIIRFLQLGFSGKQLFLKTEKGLKGLFKTPTLDLHQWYLVTYTYDGYEVGIYLNNVLIYQSKETSIYTKLPYKKDHLYLAKGRMETKQFQGALDEIMVFDEQIEGFTINAILEKYRKKATPRKVEKPKKKSKPITQPIKVESKEKRKDFYHKIYKKRLTEIQDSIEVSSTNIEFEIWDYDKYDNDKINMILNQYYMIQENIPLKKRSKRRKYSITNAKMEENANNYITFFAEDMGKYPSQNTAAVRLWIDGKKQDKIYKFVLTEDINAALKIKHFKEIPKKVPKENLAKSTDFVDFKTVKMLEPLTVERTDLKFVLENLAEDAVTAETFLDETSLFGKMKLGYYPTNKNFTIEPTTMNRLVIKSHQLEKGQQANLRLSIKSGQKVLKTYTFDLQQGNFGIPIQYQAPIIVTRRPKNKYELTVRDTILTIKIMDNSVVDGDIVTIKQGGKIVLENYKLTAEPKAINVQLLQNQENSFVFVPVSMGSKNTENTALVIIEADGRVIDKFTLSSRTKDNPARLKIVHKK